MLWNWWRFLWNNTSTKEFFDLSNQPKDSKYYCNDNKKVPGKMKDEYGGIHIYEFIGLKSKIYSIRDVNKKRKKYT